MLKDQPGMTMYQPGVKPTHDAIHVVRLNHTRNFGYLRRSETLPSRALCRSVSCPIRAPVGSLIPAVRSRRGSPAPCAKQGHDDDCGQDAECSELSGTEHWPGAHMTVLA